MTLIQMKEYIDTQLSVGCNPHKEVCIVIDDPNATAGANPPRKITGMATDDFNDVDRIAVITEMKEVD